VVRKPVAIIKNGRPWLSGEDYGQLRWCDRRALSAGEISDRHLAALREAKIPDCFADLDAELKNWKP
jgi:hypothetical protein